MQRLRRILIATSLILFAILLIGFMLPSFWKVERSIVIEAPAASIYSHLNNLKNWPRWVVWYQQQPPIPIQYSGPLSGIGATSRWNDENGTNVLKIMQTEKNYRIDYQILFHSGMSRTEGRFLLEPAGAATRVVWQAGGANRRDPASRYYALFLRIKIANDYDASLRQLKQEMEMKLK